jgi:hypothetical protein
MPFEQVPVEATPEARQDEQLKRISQREERVRFARDHGYVVQFRRNQTTGRVDVRIVRGAAIVDNFDCSAENASRVLGMSDAAVREKLDVASRVKQERNTDFVPSAETIDAEIGELSRELTVLMQRLLLLPSQAREAVFADVPESHMVFQTGDIAVWLKSQTDFYHRQGVDAYWGKCQTWKSMARLAKLLSEEM